MVWYGLFTIVSITTIYGIIVFVVPFICLGAILLYVTFPKRGLSRRTLIKIMIGIYIFFSVLALFLILVISVGKGGKSSIEYIWGKDDMSKQEYILITTIVNLLFLIPVLLWINVLAIYFTRRKIAKKVNNLPEFRE